jgi:CBS domain-containing protein
MRHCQLRDVMNPNPVTVTSATPLKKVAEILVGGEVGGVPVLTAQGQVVGVITEGDDTRLPRAAVTIS